MTLTEWQLEDITRQACEYRRSHKPARCRALGKAPRNIQQRSSGETALFDGFGWIYSPHGLAKETWDQIYELTEQKKGRIQVIRWPEAEVAYDNAVKNRRGEA